MQCLVISQIHPLALLSSWSTRSFKMQQMLAYWRAQSCQLLSCGVLFWKNNLQGTTSTTIFWTRLAVWWLVWSHHPSGWRVASRCGWFWSYRRTDFEAARRSGMSNVERYSKQPRFAGATECSTSACVVVLSIVCLFVRGANSYSPALAPQYITTSQLHDWGRYQLNTCNCTTYLKCVVGYASKWGALFDTKSTLKIRVTLGPSFLDICRRKGPHKSPDFLPKPKKKTAFWGLVGAFSSAYV